MPEITWFCRLIKISKNVLKTGIICTNELRGSLFDLVILVFFMVCACSTGLIDGRLSIKPKAAREIFMTEYIRLMYRKMLQAYRVTQAFYSHSYIWININKFG